MDATRFLSEIWPSEGPYALATPIQKGGYAHHVVHTPREAAQRAAFLANKGDVFFAVLALREERIWSPTKIDYKTGEKGAHAIRTHANMRAARAFFVDLDVGPEDDRYLTQRDAIADLKRFVSETYLPKPCVISSGRGVHVYWRIGEDVAVEDWLPLAKILKRLAAHHQLRADPSRTSDPSSVLRVVGTYNYKGEEPKLVKALKWSQAISLDAWRGALQAAAIRAGQDTTALSEPRATPPEDDELGSNLDAVYDGPPPTIKALGKACAQVKAFGRVRGNVSEPLWYSMLQLIRYVEDGRHWAHQLSAGHPGYTQAETDERLDRLELQSMGPASCARIADLAGAKLCEGCRYLDRVKSPLVAARNEDTKAPVVIPAAQPDDADIEIPDPPMPYKRIKARGIVIYTTNADGEDSEATIYEHDLYPVRRVYDEVRKVQHQVWRADLPHKESPEFVVDAGTLYRQEMLASCLAANGVFVRPAQIKGVQDYMSAYIAQLQKMQARTTSFDSLGWHEEHSMFVLPERAIDRDGKTRSCQLTTHAKASSKAVTRSGDLATQVELLKFYARSGYEPQQTMVLGALAAPLLHMTGHHGLVMNATGKPGASKSTSLYTGASLWAQPQTYPLSGTNLGATQKARMQRMATMGSLPVMVDEITTMSYKDAQEMVMSVTQPVPRTILDRSGHEKERADGEKSTIMLCTANNSLHSLLAHENVAGTAGSMRVVEIEMRAGVIHQKHEADEYLSQLREHYGHVGEVYVREAMQRYDEIAARIKAQVRRLDEASQIESAERFWTAALGCCLVAGELSREMGLLQFDTEALERWMLGSLLPGMRGVVATEYAGGLNILADFVEHSSGSIAVTKASGSGTFILRAPGQRMVAHIDQDLGVMAVLRSAFKEYCTRIGASMQAVIDELHQPTPGLPSGSARVIPVPDTRRTLAHGTEFAKMQSRCFLVSMAHPEVTGAVNLSLVEGRDQDPPRQIGAGQP